MADTDRDEPRPATRSPTLGKDADKNGERRRLAEALRANLERRKTQKRARQGHEADAGDR